MRDYVWCIVQHRLSSAIAPVEAVEVIAAFDEDRAAYDCMDALELVFRSEGWQFHTDETQRFIIDKGTERRIYSLVCVTRFPYTVEKTVKQPEVSTG